MSNIFKKWNKTPTLKDIVKLVRKNCDYLGHEYPRLSFLGTVKLHGTNSCIAWTKDKEAWHYQSRNRVITPMHDNAGFASFASKVDVQEIVEDIKFMLDPQESLYIYGEFAGKGIQQSVGINGIDKSFFVFHVESDGEDVTQWLHDTMRYDPPLYSIYSFKVFPLVIDFKDIDTKTLFDINSDVNSVDQICPVAAQLLDMEDAGHGEGIVYTAVNLLSSDSKVDDGTGNGPQTIRFKAKGESHSNVKAKVKRPQTEQELLNLDNAEKFLHDLSVDYYIEQQFTEHFSQPALEPENKDIAPFIKFVFADILSEHKEDIERLGITREVSKIINRQSAIFLKRKINRL